MAWEGDPPGVCFPVPHSVFGAPMPTAICRIYTREGFRVSADGRKIIIAPGQYETKEEIQKIFPLETPGGKLACSFGGTVGHGAADDDQIVFAFPGRTAAAAEELKDARPETLYEYAQMLATALHRSLLAVQQTGTIA